MKIRGPLGGLLELRSRTVSTMNKETPHFLEIRIRQRDLHRMFFFWAQGLGQGKFANSQLKGTFSNNP